jgi:magnesium transporter
MKHKRSAALRPRYNNPGASPGLGSRLARRDYTASLSLVSYSKESIVEQSDVSTAECLDSLSKYPASWIHVQGIPEQAWLSEMAEAFKLHRLSVEDVLHGRERPKLENYDEHLFVILLMPRITSGRVELVQVSLFVGNNWLISFCDGAEDPFDPIRDRLRLEPPGNIRQRGPDYLLYALADLVVDHGFPVLEDRGNQLEFLEEQTLEDPEPGRLEQIYAAKHDLIVLRKALWPQREVLGILSRDAHAHIKARTLPYLRDCYDHAIQTLELLESYREMVSGLHDLYLSSISKRMNDIMKVLTIIATLFIPLSFVAGLYGMNFNTAASPLNMPELHWYFGYPAVLLLMFGIVVGMLIFFRRKRWI